jgi:formate hydrogenlyase subunit 4
MTDILAQCFILIAMPPLLIGIINKVKAFFAGRRGPPLLQPYYDILKLLRKGLAVSRTTTWVFFAGPAAALAGVALAGLIVPIGSARSPISFAGDMILFAYLFGLARFFTTAAALDTGSAFEGMGAAREATFACLSEPALFFAFLALARRSGSLSLSGMLGVDGGFSAASAAAMVLVALGLFIVLLAEGCRIPVDDPTTHLELTMIHEVMVLDHSGPLLGLVEYASAMKLLVIESLLLGLLPPLGTGNPWLDRAAFAAALAALAAVVGVVESIMARLRMPRVSYLLTGALLLCGSGFVLLVR